ncbi:hypothetical protein AB4159_16725 [Vibrio cyclitrophicus]
MIRISVAEAMINDLVINSNVLFGSGVGSSESKMEIEYFGDVLYYSSHSGLLSIFYEFGIIGLLTVTLFFIQFLSFRVGRIQHVESLPRFFRPLSSLLLLGVVIIWIYYNVVYVFSIPASQSYYFYQAPLFIMLITFFSRTLRGIKII